MISSEEIEKLSHLCKIRLTSDEIVDFQRKLKSVIALIDQLQNIDTKGIEPLTSVSGQELRLRQDIVTVGKIEEQLFANVPGDTAPLAKEIKCFIVPKMVE